MLFIVSSNTDKVDPDTRKQIRSHVMRGKKPKRVRPVRGRKTMRDGTQVALKLEDVVALCAPLFPGRVGSDLSFVEFPDAIEPSTIVKWRQVSPVAMRVIFPLLETVGFRTDPTDIFYSMNMDAAALHITAFAVDGFIDRILRHQRYSTNPVAMLHLQRGLKLLQEKLWGEDDETKVSDSTIKAVLKLASTAHFDGDAVASKNHMQGLRKMVDLRGGLHIFTDNKILMEMLRCDLSIALLNCSAPVFFRQPLETVPQYPEKLLTEKIHLEENTDLLPDLNGDLAMTWRALKRFCLLIDIGLQTQRLINPNIICETMTTATYHLLHMNFATNAIDEGVRLGLLAFCHHIFLQWQDIVLPYYQFPAVYRRSVLNLRNTSGIHPQLILWLLITGTNSLYDLSEESWLRECLREHFNINEIKTWRDMQKILESFLWIDLLDADRGRQVFDSLHEKTV